VTGKVTGTREGGNWTRLDVLKQTLGQGWKNRLYSALNRRRGNSSRGWEEAGGREWGWGICCCYLTKGNSIGEFLSRREVDSNWLTREIRPNNTQLISRLAVFRNAPSPREPSVSCFADSWDIKMEQLPRRREIAYRCKLGDN